MASINYIDVKCIESRLTPETLHILSDISKYLNYLNALNIKDYYGWKHFRCLMSRETIKYVLLNWFYE